MVYVIDIYLILGWGSGYGTVSSGRLFIHVPRKSWLQNWLLRDKFGPVWNNQHEEVNIFCFVQRYQTWAFDVKFKSFPRMNRCHLARWLQKCHFTSISFSVTKKKIFSLFSHSDQLFLTVPLLLQATLFWNSELLKFLCNTVCISYHQKIFIAKQLNFLTV